MLCQSVKKLLDELKGFDPNYFYEYDDTDICFRAIKRGYKVKFLPISIIHHKHGALPKDLRSREIRLTYFLENRRLYFLLKNFSRGYLIRKMPKVLFYFFGSTGEITLFLALALLITLAIPQTRELVKAWIPNQFFLIMAQFKALRGEFLMWKKESKQIVIPSVFYVFFGLP
ncbi:MAG: hypothetical protein NO130_01340 [Sulfolobales archaeon]|nr:hypothetical protein [Sulfolobales archaeon]